MKNKCVNYRIWLMMLLPILGILFSLGLLYASIPWAVIFFLLCAAMIVLYVLTEPTSYLIDEAGLTVVCAFKKTFLPWKEITKIEVQYDIMFRMLFIKHYILYRPHGNRIPGRKDCVIKTKKTARLLKTYYPGKIIES